MATDFNIFNTKLQLYATLIVAEVEKERGRNHKMYKTKLWEFFTK
jgi:hypothetical protein